MIVLIGAEKGGTGKTTIATSLAAMRTNEGHDVLLLDTDPQGTATYWNRLRDQTEAAKITCVQVFGEVDREIRKLASKYDEIIIDAGGRDSEELRSSILVAHKIYIPLQPSQFDIWTITQMAKIVERGKTFNKNLSAYILLNLASTHPYAKEIEEVQETIKGANFKHLELSQVVMKKRNAFQKAASMGLSVTELENESNAVAEITRLYKEIYED